MDNKMAYQFEKVFGVQPTRFFSAPGRTEIGGNHTDHQHGCVLAAAVNLEAVAAVRENGTNEIRVLSEGYLMCSVSLGDFAANEKEYGTTTALIRGVAAKFAALGCKIKGFDAYVESTVLPGSGLSSSAAFEVLIGTVLNGMFFEKKLSAPDIAKIGQYAENVYFGKPCGLMDQMASSVGNLVAIDFCDPENPVITPIPFDFSACGYALCIIDSKASHADLTDEYAAVPQEMCAVAKCMGKAVLREADEAEFYQSLPILREKCGDRAVLRAMHFFAENKRAQEEAAALQSCDFDQFLQLVRASGMSSWMYLQNVIPAGYKEHQDMAIALALCDKLLCGKGAFRVHGGGFAGTVQAFVPNELLDAFKNNIEAALGENTCHVLSIRKEGGVELEAER